MLLLFCPDMNEARSAPPRHDPDTSEVLLGSPSLPCAKGLPGSPPHTVSLACSLECRGRPWGSYPAHLCESDPWDCRGQT